MYHHPRTDTRTHLPQHSSLTHEPTKPKLLPRSSHRKHIIPHPPPTPSAKPTSSHKSPHADPAPARTINPPPYHVPSFRSQRTQSLCQNPVLPGLQQTHFTPLPPSGDIQRLLRAALRDACTSIIRADHTSDATYLRHGCRGAAGGP